MTAREQDVARLAASLSETQRALLLTLPRAGKGDPPAGHWVLWDFRLASCQITGNDVASRWNITITPLGLAVRTHLQKEPRS